MHAMGIRLPGRNAQSMLLGAAIAFVSATACSPGVPSASAGALVSPFTQTPTIAGGSSPRATSETQSPSTGAVASAAAGPFAFSSDAITSFYEGSGFDCNPGAPSTTAEGWFVRTCQGRNSDGRTVVIGVITDEAGTLGAGFATVTALEDEDLLEPTDALDTLSGFLGAMLGEEPATGILPWVASHLGDEYAETMVGDVTVATYTESPDDATRIYLEVDGPAYLAAPPPQ